MFTLLPAVAALVLPGLGLELALVHRSPGPLVRAVRAFLLSLAFWPVAVFATRVLPLSLGGLAWGGLGLGAALCAVGLRLRRPGMPGTPASNASAWLPVIFGAVALAHLLPVRTWVVAPGADMSMHTFMARLIAEAGRLPASYEPLYPIHDFGSYAAGLPALSAVLSRLSGAPVHRTALTVSLLAYPALVGGLFLVAQRFAHQAAALASAVLVLFGTNAHGFLGWGGNPTILSLALALAAVAPALGPALDRRKMLDDGGALFPVLIAGAGLVHIIPLLGLAYCAPISVLLWLRAAPAGSRRGLIAAWAALLAAAAVVLGLPYLLGTRPTVSERALAWTANWQRNSDHAYRGGTWANFPLTIWAYLWERLGLDSLLLLLAGIAGAARSRDRRQVPWLAFSGAVLLLILNSRYWVLPGSAALYPERMALLLAAPLAALVGVALEQLARWLGRVPADSARLVVVGTLAFVLGAWMWDSVSWKLASAGRMISVTPNDVEAMRWIEANVPKEAVFESNYGDAGLWIPALAFRAIHHPHSNPFYFGELDAWAATVSPRYLYVGNRAVYDSMPYPRDQVRSDPRYQQLYAAGGAAVYEIRSPEAAARR